MKPLAVDALALVVMCLVVVRSSAQTQQSPDLATLISREVPGFRLAQSTDYVPALQARNRGEPVLQEDFNRDGMKDWAAIVINDRLREYRVYYVVSDAGSYKLNLLLTRTWQTSSNNRPINTPMFLKPAGDPGISGRSYNSLKGDRTAYTSVPAIEVWTGQKHNEADKELEEISYCSTTWYYERAMLKSFEACD
jgi:hypothetical protein